MNDLFYAKTLRFRHLIVRAVAPKIFVEATSKLRRMDAYCKSLFNSNPILGVEVGVWRGEHAWQMLNMFNFSRLYLVDHYAPFVEEGKFYSRELMMLAKQEAERKLSRYPQAEFMFMSSYEASRKLDGLDYVYIDATHTYNAVAQDLEAWYPKVREGGVIGGHDFTPEFQGLIRAVVDIVSFLGAKLHFEGSDWWIVKGEKNEGLFS